MLSLLVAEPEFAGQTKDKLTNTDLYEEIKTEVLDKFRLYFEQNPTHAESIVQRVLRPIYLVLRHLEAGQRSVLQSTPVVATPEVYKSQFGERSKNCMILPFGWLMTNSWMLMDPSV